MSIIDEKARVSFRTDAKLKEEATKVLADMQLDLTTAFNLFLDQVVKQNKLPFEVTNETAEERKIREIRREVEKGILEARAGTGINARDYRKQLETKKAQLLNG
ncbi:type II toxin-antitoxin system RelB/DinJ family antitoxin [Enterococcus casseliflavus]|uniref:type II toxin-antitoxin system RelB/DinJ family antitoxin n=1 Tax=Enterococcus casseliflavus TaxID=37734 RepID=UPI00163D4455|nr:type II toxin-antitoxin system RelB/DinJ family antitoxin [Enterococcus casseliflavus]